MAKIVLVKGYDFTKKINRTWAEYFDVDKLEVDTVTLDPDKELEKKLKDDALFAQQLRDAATDYLDTVAKTVDRVFVEQVAKVEKALGAGGDPARIQKEVEDVKHTVTVAVKQAVESAAKGAEQAVGKAFDDYTRRKKDATKYRWKFGFDCTVTAIGLATGVTSLVLAAGGAGVGVLGVLNSLSKVALLLREATRDVDQTAEALEKMVERLAKDIDAEIAKGMKQAGLEVAAAALPVLTTMKTTINTADARADELNAKIEKCDRQCRDMVAEVLKAVRKIDEIEKQTEKLPKLADKVKKIAAKNDELLKKVQSLQPELKRQQAFQKSAAAQIDEWKAKRAKKVAIATRVATATEIGDAIYSLLDTSIALASAL